MKYLALSLALLSILAPTAHAQEKERIGLGYSVQAGYEFMNYSEQSVTVKGEDAEYAGSSASIVASASIEFDMQPQLKLPLFLAVSGAMPVKSFAGQDRNTFLSRENGARYLSQTNDVTHEYSMARVFLGYKLKPVLSPFILFERALFQSTRWNMMIGTDSGTLVPADTGITWHERVWSSHIGAGLQGSMPLDQQNLFGVRYRVAVLFPIASFLTNDHPRINSTNGELGRDAEGNSILSRLALHYNWKENIAFELGANWYYRRWEGKTNTIKQGVIDNMITWPPNDMDAVPVMLSAMISI